MTFYHVYSYCVPCLELLSVTIEGVFSTVIGLYLRLSLEFYLHHRTPTIYCLCLARYTWQSVFAYSTAAINWSEEQGDLQQLFNDNIYMNLIFKSRTECSIHTWLRKHNNKSKSVQSCRIIFYLFIGDSASLYSLVWPQTHYPPAWAWDYRLVSLYLQKKIIYA